MSFTESVEPFKIVGINDPLINVNANKAFVVMKSGKYLTSKLYSTTSFSTSSLNFSCPPPSPSTVVDRLVYLTLYVRFVFDQPPILGVADAPRQFPIMSNMQTLQTTINNTTFTQNSSNYVQALMKYDLNNDKIAGVYSETPALYDMNQNYEDWTTLGSARSPFSFFNENAATISRGAYTPTAISVDGKTLDYTFTEPLLLQSPFIWGDNDEHNGFINVNTMDFVFTFNSNLSRMWSHDPVNGNAITSINVTFPQSPLLRFFYISPQDTTPIPSQISYSYTPLDRYITSGLTLASGASGTITCNNIQLQQIPKCVYHFVQRTDSQKTFSTTDTYAVINNINVQFNNMTGLLSSATSEDLYKMAKRNGLCYSWVEWNQYIGSVLRIDFGNDIGLPPQLAPSVMGNYNYQAQITFTNKSNASIQYDVFTVMCYDGVVTVSVGSCIPQTGIVSPVSVLESSNLPQLDYQMVKSQVGGNVFGKLKSFIGNLSRGAQFVGSVGKTFAPQYAAPLTALEAIGTAGRQLTGMGRRKKKGRYYRRRGRGLVGSSLYDDEENEE